MPSVCRPFLFLLTLLAAPWWSARSEAAAQPASGLPPDGFLEPETPFLRTALVFEADGTPNRVRRGVLLPLGHRHWACFDPDLLRWAAVWRTPEETSPISNDSMAAVSFPNERAKATKPPGLRGTLLAHAPELPGAGVGSTPGPDPRTSFLVDGKTPVGPLPREAGQWLGLSLRGTVPVLHYQVGRTEVSETMRAEADGTIQRCLQVGPSPSPLAFRLAGGRFSTDAGPGIIRDGVLHLPASDREREVLLFTSPARPENPLRLPGPQSASPVFPETTTVDHPAPVADGPFAIRNIPLPAGPRPVRTTDLTFLSDGTALLTTFDGDLWRIERLEEEQSRWTRVATGLFEPMAIASDADDRVFILGRDQVTEVIDTNQDGHIDLFRCASDTFLQTLHTRDFATSLEIAPDGSFLVAKGGIAGGRGHEELSGHRGTILRLPPDGGDATVLADGLRMPFVGLRDDGSVFASDQQGHHVPSTPVHLLRGERPYLGFAPTDFRSLRKPVEPLLYFPYQANRSAAGFVSTSSRAFADLGASFLQVSWNGRLFGIITPESGQPFAWQWPLQLRFPSLQGATHPRSGRLYVTGLGISAYKATTPELFGLASVEQARPFPAPAVLDVSPQEVTVRFRRPLAADEAVIPGSPALRLFNVERSPKYGSGHFRWDGKPGEHQLQPSGFRLSPDRTTLVLKFDRLRESDVLDLKLSVSAAGTTSPLHLFSRPVHLPEARANDLAALTRADKAPAPPAPGDPAKGKPLFVQFACVGCHSLDGEALAGPPLGDVGRRLDAAQLREAILDPAARITEGYPPSMPSFAGVIPPQDLEHLIAYLLGLK